MMTRFSFAICSVAVLCIAAGCHSLIENASHLFSQDGHHDEGTAWGNTGEATEWAPPVFSMSFSPDAQQLAIGNFVGLHGHFDDSRYSALFSTPIYSLWHRDVSYPSGELFYKRCGYRTRNHGSTARVQMSRDGRRFAADLGKSVEVHDAQNGNLIHRVNVPEDGVAQVIFPDCQKIVWRARDLDGPELISVVDVETGNITATYDLGKQSLMVLAISPNSRRLAISHNVDEPLHHDADLMILDLTVGEVVRTIRMIPGLRTFANPVFSENGSQIVVACSPDMTPTAMNTKSVSVWEIESGQRTWHWTLTDECFIWDVDISSDSRFVAAGVERKEPGRGEIHVWDLLTGEKTAEWNIDETWGITAVEFTPDGSTLAAGGGDGKILFYDVPKDEDESDGALLSSRSFR